MVPIDLSGRVALVTGAAKGIGRATTLLLLQAGSSVVANVRERSAEATELVDQCEAAYPGRLTIAPGDIADTSTVDDILKLVFSKFKRLDVVVNNAGIMLDGMIGMISDADIQLTLRTNVIGLLKVTQGSARIMKRHRSGSIINLSSIIGRRGNANQMLYSASKAAVIGATLSAAKELGPQGIRVNAVAPGIVDTQMTAQLTPETRAKVLSQISMGRTGTPEDIAKTILFLASDLSSYVTGQIVGVDGGMVI
jgi:3-oxoacyl-[acyl-carrier protein] reductase